MVRIDLQSADWSRGKIEDYDLTYILMNMAFLYKKRWIPSHPSFMRITRLELARYCYH